MLAQAYTPGPAASRLWPNTPPAAATVLTLVLANLAVFVAWRVPRAWRFLNRYFVCIPGWPYAVSIVGNTFSHQTFWHLAANMAVLWLVGTRLHDQIGRGAFLGLYLSAGAVGTLASLLGFVASCNLVGASLGASGAIFGILGAYCYLNLDKYFTVAFLPRDLAVPPVSSLTLLVTLVLLEVAGVLGRWKAVDHNAHLAGLLTGIGGAWALKRRARERRGLVKMEAGPVSGGERRTEGLRSWVERLREGRG